MGAGEDGVVDAPGDGCPRDDARGRTAPAAGRRSWTDRPGPTDGPADRPADPAGRPDRAPDADAWPAPVHAPNCDRATLLRRIVGG